MSLSRKQFESVFTNNLGGSTWPRSSGWLMWHWGQTADKGKGTTYLMGGDTGAFSTLSLVAHQWFTWLHTAYTIESFVCGKQNPHDYNRLIWCMARHGQAALRKGQTPRNLNSSIILSGFGKCDFYPFLLSFVALREENNPPFPPNQNQI